MGEGDNLFETKRVKISTFEVFREGFLHEIAVPDFGKN
jgi:hypothetical protein